MYANRFVRLLCQEEASFTIVGYCAVLKIRNS